MNASSRSIPFVLGVLPLAALAIAAPEETRTETFDRDPRWIGVNNRAAREREPVTIRQDFGYWPTNRAGGDRGEIGGFVTPAGEAAHYAKRIEARTLDDRLEASGTFYSPPGAYHVLLGFFRHDTTNEWRTPSTIALRLNGRGDRFFAYVEYCTARWRAGGDTEPFPFTTDASTGRSTPVGFACGKPYRWTLSYDPRGGGEVTATIGGATASCRLDDGHKADGALFDRFGLLNVVKSADTGGEVYLDDVTVGGALERFDVDPGWEGRSNRRTYESTLVRPRCDVGHSLTNLAGGRSAGELGGVVFRGDCRYPERMAAIGDAVGPLSLERPFRASGKVAVTRGVSDSTTLFGFYSSEDSLRSNPSQKQGIPESVVGIHIEGPSRDGFLFYPVHRVRGGEGRSGLSADAPPIHPDGASHDWTLEYDPSGAGGRGRVTVSLDGRTASLDLAPGDKGGATRLDRFGIVTSWIDGNSQSVYWDDITYTMKQ